MPEDEVPKPEPKRKFSWRTLAGAFNPARRDYDPALQKGVKATRWGLIGFMIVSLFALLRMVVKESFEQMREDRRIDRIEAREDMKALGQSLKEALAPVASKLDNVSQVVTTQTATMNGVLLGKGCPPQAPPTVVIREREVVQQAPPKKPEEKKPEKEEQKKPPESPFRRERW